MRNASALAAITGRGIKVDKIRAGKHPNQTDTH